MGEHGLRAGWSAVIFLAIVVPLGFTATLIPHSSHPGPSLVQESILLAALFIATWVMAKIERRTVWSYGFLDDRKWVRLASGTAVGILLFSLLVAVLWANHLLLFDRVALSGWPALKYAALWGLVFLVVAFFEEGLLRGYLQFTLARGLSFWRAAVILSVIFGIMHLGNAGESLAGALAAAVGGIVFCLSLKLTGSLWWIVGVHAGWDWAEGYFYGAGTSGEVEQGHLFESHPSGNPLWSGGDTGPEGSPYALLIFLLLGLGIWMMWGKENRVGRGRPTPAPAQG